MKFTRPRVLIYGILALLIMIVCMPMVAKLFPKPPQETPPPNTIIVSKEGEGQHETIGEAIKNAGPNMRILVRPGVYKESLIIDRPIEIIGDSKGTDSKTVIESPGPTCVLMQAENATLRDLTLRAPPGLKAGIFKFLAARNEGGGPCVDIERGQLTLENCDMTSEAVASIGVHGYAANAIVRGCKIHDGNSNGIWVTDHASATVEDCDLGGMSWAAVRIEDGGNVVLQRCKIHNVKNCGVLATNYARGRIEGCDIFANALVGVEVRDRSNVTILNSKVFDCKESGIWFRQNSTGSVESSEVFRNGGVGIVMMEDSSPTIVKCSVFENLLSNVEINRGADPVIRDCKIHGGSGSGIQVHESAKGTIEDCEIFGHQNYPQITMTAGANPTFRRCNVYDGGAGGVLVLKDATGTLEDCSIYDNHFAGVGIREDAGCTIRRCKINRNNGPGIAMDGNGSATVEDSDMTANIRGPWDIQAQAQVRRSRNKE